MTFVVNVLFCRILGCWSLAAAAVLLVPLAASAHDELPAHHKVLPSTATEVMKAFWITERVKQDLTSVSGPDSTTAAAACDPITGLADPSTDPTNTDLPYPCDGIDLQSFLSLNDIGGTASNSEANDI